jgi:hypothetical protein
MQRARQWVFKLCAGSGLSRVLAAVVSLGSTPDDDVEGSVQGDVAGGGYLLAYRCQVCASLRVPDDLVNGLPDVAAAASERATDVAVLQRHQLRALGGRLSAPG